MIQEFTDMGTAQQQADAVPEPKHVWWDIDRIVVYTGDDYAPPPSAQLQ